MDISQLYPLPILDLSDLTVPGEKYQNYFKYYGIDFDVPHYFGCVPVATQSVVDKFDIACHIFLPENVQGSVFVLHGLYDHVGLYKHVIEHALVQNMAVFAFDLPGHGLSSGERASIKDFSQYADVFDDLVNQLQSFMPKPWHVVAQSTGASVVTDFLLKNREQNFFATHAFLAPLVRPYLWPLYSILFNIIKFFIKERKRHFRANSFDAEFLDFLKNKDPLQSRKLKSKWIVAMQKRLKRFLRQAPVDNREILIFQGDKDKTIDKKYGAKLLLQKFPGSQVAILEGAEHHLSNESPITRQKWQAGLTKLWQS